MKKILTLCVFMFVVLTGCATHEKFVKRYDRWVGSNIHHFIAVEGHPDRSIKLPNGNTVYIYEHSRIYTVPTMGPILFDYYHHHGVFGFGISNEIQQEVCKLYIETDKKGKIVRWSSRGNACRSK